MTTSHILKSEGKPNLFSFDIESEIKNIEKWVYDNRNYAKRDLQTEFETLKNLAIDYIDIIESKSISERHLNNLRNAISNGAGGVWENALTKSENLAYHFNEVKSLITELIKNGNSKTIERLLTSINESFTNEEQIEIFSIALRHKSKRVKKKAADSALDMRNMNLIPLLKEIRSKESDSEVINSLDFAIENMWQKKGELIFNAPEY